MENYVIEDNIPVFGKIVKTFPKGINEALALPEIGNLTRLEWCTLLFTTHKGILSS